MQRRNRRLQIIGGVLMVLGLLVLGLGFAVDAAVSTMPAKQRGPAQAERLTQAKWLKIGGFLPMFSGLSMALFAGVRDSWMRPDD